MFPGELKIPAKTRPLTVKRLPFSFRCGMSSLEELLQDPSGLQTGGGNHQLVQTTGMEFEGGEPPPERGVMVVLLFGRGA